MTPASQTIRVQQPAGTTILKASPQGQTVQGAGGKQIITVHKTGQVSSQPQIVTLVKTTQGMTVAQVRRATANSNDSLLDHTFPYNFCQLYYCKSIFSCVL